MIVNIFRIQRSDGCIDLLSTVFNLIYETKGGDNDVIAHSHNGVFRTMAMSYV